MEEAADKEGLTKLSQEIKNYIAKLIKAKAVLEKVKGLSYVQRSAIHSVAENIDESNNAGFYRLLRNIREIEVELETFAQSKDPLEGFNLNLDLD